MYVIIVLSSVTYALKAQAQLDKNGIRSELTKQAEIRRVKGCAYGLRLAATDALRAEKILLEQNIKILGKVETVR